MTQAEHRRDRLNEYRRAAGLPPVGPYGWPAFPDADDQARTASDFFRSEIESIRRYGVEAHNQVFRRVGAA